MNKLFLLWIGHFFLIIGFIGIFLPILPTTPFLLLAAYFYSKTNSRFHTWIINHKLLGPPIQKWERSGAIDLKSKIIATIMLGLVLVLKVPHFKIVIVYKIVIVLILLLVLLFIWTRPSGEE